MRKIVTENIEKLIAAGSAEETAKILRAAGEDISPEEAEQLFKEIKDHFSGSELSLDELEAVSGGADIDWAKNGCAGTVELGSWCRSNDACTVFSVTYDHRPLNIFCPNCRIPMYLHSTNGVTNTYKCRICGSETYEKCDDDWEAE